MKNVFDKVWIVSKGQNLFGRLRNINRVFDHPTEQHNFIFQMNSADHKAFPWLSQFIYTALKSEINNDCNLHLGLSVKYRSFVIFEFAESRWNFKYEMLLLNMRGVG